MTEDKVLFDPSTERLDEINESLKIIQRKRGLTFGTDAYLLGAFMKSSPKGVAADFGCGTGVISLLCAARRKFSHIYAFELQREFAELTQRNIELNNLDTCMSVTNIDVRDITQKHTNGQIDAVFTNPPYMKCGSGLENPDDEKNIARRELNGTIYDFCVSAGRVLKSGGAFYAVHRPERLVDLICAMRQASIEPKIIVNIYPTSSSKPSLVLVEGKKDASSSVILTRPLIIYKDGTREYTEDMERIYSEFSMSHITER